MLTVLKNIRSTKVLHCVASCIMPNASCIILLIDLSILLDLFDKGTVHLDFGPLCGDSREYTGRCQILYGV